MKKGEKLKFYIKIDNHFYQLFNVIQMGKDSIVDLKITDFYNNFVFITKNKQGNNGYLTEFDFKDLRYAKNVEMSYHKDGSFLRKIKDEVNPEYSNPYGEGERWTATNKIDDFQPIMHIAILQITIFKNSSLEPILKSKESLYVCENDDLFEKHGTYSLILYIRNKNQTVNCYTTKNLYSDVIINLNNELDLCIFIQRYSFPKPKPYFSKELKCYITPSKNNTISFCSREYTKDEMIDKFDKSIFDLLFNQFLTLMSDEQFINLSEDKLLLIDQVDLIYKGNEGKMPLPKPVFIKGVLKLFGEQLSVYNKFTDDIKQVILLSLNKLLVMRQAIRSKSIKTDNQ